MAKVTVYSTPTCPYCVQLKNYLTEKGVVFEEKNVAEDAAARDEMVEKSGQLGVPVSVIDEEVVIGFDQAKIDGFLKLG